MMRYAAPLFAAALLAAPVAVHARAPAAPAQVNVTIGKSLAARADRYGPRELDYLRSELTREVAAAAGRGGFTRLDLVLQDATPNRPTPNMRARVPGVDLSSTSLGGATITGVAYGPSGRQPVKSSFYETNFDTEVASDAWYDASKAFRFLAADLRRGRAPDRFGPNTPANIAGNLNPLDPWNFPR